MKAFLKNSILTAIIALIIFMLPMGNFVALADTNKAEGYEVKITSGIEGKFRALKHIPVTVEFTSFEKDFNGEVEIRTTSSYASTYDAYSKEISVAAGETGKVTIPIKLVEGSSKISVNLVENGKVLFEKKSIISNGRVTESNLFMGILTDDPTALSYTGSVSFDTANGFQGVIEKVQLDENIIGENSLNIDGLDVIIINNYNMASLKDNQYIALSSWVNKGGTLVIGSGANASKTITNIDSNFLNIKSNGNKEKNINIADENLNLIVSDLEVEGGKIKLGDKENPLAYYVNKGSGEVLIATFDLGLEPFISSNASKEFTTSLLLDAANKVFTNNMNGGYSQNFYRLRELTQNLPINDIVGVKSLMVVLALYILIIGIIIYIVLKKLDKRDLTWIAIPLTAILFTIVIYFMGSKTRVNDIVLNQNNIISVDKNGQGTARGYLGIGTKYKSDVIIEKPEDLTMNYASTDNYYYSEEDITATVLRVKTTYSGNNSYFTFNDSDALDMKSFEIIGKELVISNIESDFNLSEGNLNGIVKNNLGYDINRLILVSGRSVWDMGLIKKDEEKEISQLKISGTVGLQAYSDIINQKYYESRWNNNIDIESEEFKNLFRVSSLIGAISDEMMFNTGTKLIAITDYPVEYGVEFGRKSISKFDTTAIIQEAELDFKDENGEYNFPDGFFEETIESSDTTVSIDDYNGYIYGQGEVVFNFQVDSNIEITELIIRKGVDRYGYSGDDNSEKYIYNYKTDNYDKIEMYQGYENIADLENYTTNNRIKVKYVVDDNNNGKGGQSMIPMITVTGRER